MGLHTQPDGTLRKLWHHTLAFSDSWEHMLAYMSWKNTSLSAFSNTRVITCPSHARSVHARGDTHASETAVAVQWARPSCEGRQEGGKGWVERRGRQGLGGGERGERERGTYRLQHRA
jgi:hypothetical protein